MTVEQFDQKQTTNMKTPSIVLEQQSKELNTNAANFQNHFWA